MRTRIKRKTDIADAIKYYGEDILCEVKFRNSDKSTQHGKTSVMDHSISVAYVSVKLAQFSHLRYDFSALVRGALLHDYFCYDWHDHEKPHHSVRHADTACKNAAETFAITPIEANMIQRHMFPLNLKPPRYREGIILCIADKLCATSEIFHKTIYDETIEKRIKK